MLHRAPAVVLRNRTLLAVLCTASGEGLISGSTSHESRKRDADITIACVDTVQDIAASLSFRPCPQPVLTYFALYTENTPRFPILRVKMGVPGR